MHPRAPHTSSEAPAPSLVTRCGNTIGRTALTCCTRHSIDIALYTCTTAAPIPLSALSIALMVKIALNHYLLNLTHLGTGYVTAILGVLVGALASCFAIGSWQANAKTRADLSKILIGIGYMKEATTVAAMIMSITFAVLVDEKIDMFLRPLSIAVACFSGLSLAMAGYELIKIKQHQASLNANGSSAHLLSPSSTGSARATRIGREQSMLSGMSEMSALMRSEFRNAATPKRTQASPGWT